MANRLTRDQVINRALDMVDSPRLDEKCRAGATGPSATITDPSFATQWYQDGLDLAHNLYPMQGLLKSITVTFGEGTSDYSLPPDYVLDYAIVLDSYDASGAVNGVLGSMQRRGLDRILGYNTGVSSRSTPREYTIAANVLKIRPVPNQGPSPNGSYTGTFWYYSLPSLAGASTVATFPADFFLIEYVANRAKEWLRELPPESADKVLTSGLARAKAAGLQTEAEGDQIPIDRSSFPGSKQPYDTTYGWMGNPSL